MNKRFITIAIVLFLLLIPGKSNAQTLKYKPHFMFGATGGVNLSNMIFTPNVQQGLKVGYDAGIILRYDVGHVYDLPNVTAGVWVEVDYSERGWNEKPKDLAEKYQKMDLSYTRTLRFVNLPILTHLMFGADAFKITVDLGPHFGYLIGESSKSTFPEGNIPGVVIKQHEMPVENKFAWGVGGGIGVEYHFDRWLIGGRASYVYGLGEIYGNSRSDYFGKSSEQIVATKLYALFKF